MMIKKYGEFQRLEIVDETVSDTAIVLGSFEDEDQVVNSNLIRCELTILNPRQASLFMSTFRDCVFKPKKKVQTSWFDCAWEDCTFHGNYISTHFGILHLLKDKNPWGEILVKGCDFSQATMHFCCFRHTDVGSVVFPKWPCFTMLNPTQNFPKWKSTIFSIKDRLMDVWFANDGGVEAQVFHWPTIAKEYKIDADPEEVKRKLQSLDHILL